MLLDIGTWNVNTMLKAGKLREISDQIVGSQIQTVATPRHNIERMWFAEGRQTLSIL